MAFPGEENIQYYFEEFGDEGYGADQNNAREDVAPTPTNNGNTNKPKEPTKPPVLPGIIEINDRLAAVVELRQGLRMYLDQISDVDDLLMGLIQEYGKAFKEFEPVNNLVLGSEEAHYDVLREKGIKEFCFQAEFLELTQDTLMGKGNFVVFKQQFIHFHSSFFEDDEQVQAASIFKKPQRQESIKPKMSFVEVIPSEEEEEEESNPEEILPEKRSIREIINTIDKEKRSRQGSRGSRRGSRLGSQRSVSSINDIIKVTNEKNRKESDLRHQMEKQRQLESEKERKRKHDEKKKAQGRDSPGLQRINTNDSRGELKGPNRLKGQSRLSMEAEQQVPLKKSRVSAEQQSPIRS